MEKLHEAELKDHEADKVDYDINHAREDYIRGVLAQGKRIVLPKSNELQIDIDTADQYSTFEKAVDSLRRNDVFDFEIERHASESGWPHTHITITLPFDVDPWQRIAMQAALGSDPMRELLSSLRLIKGDEHPTLFVEPAAGGDLA